MLGVPITRFFDTLSTYMGSTFVNDFNILGPDLPGDRAGRQPVPAVGARRRKPAHPLDVGRHGAARRGRDLPRHHRALPRAALQPVSRRRGAGRDAAGLLHRPGDRRHGKDRRRKPADRLRLRMDRDRLAGKGRGQHRRRSRSASPWCSCSWCWPRNTRAAAAAGRHPGRADVPARCDQRRAAARHGQQHLHADRLRRADRPGRQERDPDRRVRQAGRGARARAAGTRPCRRRGRGCGRS